MNNRNFLRQQRKRSRRPGIYPDEYSKNKVENNILISQSCKLLKSYYNSEGITALILDGKHMRTTNSLLNLGSTLKKLIIVESNKSTYNELKYKTEGYNIIEIHNCLMDNYLNRIEFDPLINVVYFDLMENFFSSKASNGSDHAINLFLQKSKVNQIIFAATFCLRSIYKSSFELQEKKILLFLGKIFLGNGFNYRQLNYKKNMRYKGQKANNKALMFVLYKLTKDQDENVYNIEEI